MKAELKLSFANISEMTAIAKAIAESGVSIGETSEPVVHAEPQVTEAEQFDEVITAGLEVAAVNMEGVTPHGDVAVDDGPIETGAPVTPAPAPAPATTEAANDIEEVDKNGLPWDERINTANKGKTAKLVWKRKPGLTDDEYKAVIAELTDTAPAPVAAAPAPVAAAPAPVAAAPAPAPVAPAPVAPAPVAAAPAPAAPAPVAPAPVAPAPVAAEPVAPAPVAPVAEPGLSEVAQKPTTVTLAVKVQNTVNAGMALQIGPMVEHGTGGSKNIQDLTGNNLIVVDKALDIMLAEADSYKGQAPAKTWADAWNIAAGLPRQ